MKHLIQKTKRRITDWKKSFPKHISNKGSVLKLDQTAPFTFGKDWKTHLTKKIRRYVHRYFLKWKKEESLSHVWLFATTWTGAHQALLSMGFSRQEYWGRCHFLLQEIFLTQGSNSGLLHCRQTLYHVSHQGRMRIKILKIKSFFMWSYVKVNYFIIKDKYCVAELNSECST